MNSMDMLKNASKNMEIKKLKSQNAKLMEALKEIIGPMQTYVHGGNPNSPYKDEHHFFAVLGAKEALEKAKQAIAKAEGKQ